MKPILISILFFIIGCSSFKERRAKELEQIKLGMLKSEVLDIAGPPFWSDHLNGEDRWFYYSNPEDRDTEQVVYLRQNKVVRMGLRDKPLLSAEEADSLNEPRASNYQHKPSVSQDELRKIIKKELESQQPKKNKENFERL